jgi:uncharacterized protein
MMATAHEIQAKLAQGLGLRPNQVINAVRLLDEGNTIPFIARYRKEMTGGMDEEQLRQLAERLAYQRNLAERKAAVLKSIEAQGKLTQGLSDAIESAETLQEVEDLYLPYKPKRRTRATVAREHGLEPLAQLILEQPLGLDPLDRIAAPYLSPEVPTAEDAWAGARDIVAEILSDDADVRARVRALFQGEGYLRVIVVDQAADPRRTFELYYDFGMHNRSLKPHQILAINRGEAENVLRVTVQEPADKAVAAVRSLYPPRRGSPLAGELLAATEDAYQRLIRPALERELRRQLTDTAGEHAIQVFATNLRGLLLAPPLRGRTILGIDPGFRTGCKIAILNPTGAVLGAGAIYPHAPQKQWEPSKAAIKKLIQEYGIDLIAIGNGTASRETEQLAAEVIREVPGLQYLVVSEAGASVYSAMPLARKELPDLDVSLRGAVSIGRRTLDPLAELVKIDPKSIGVGLYQHDVDQKRLAEALDAVVESAVNHVGVNLNTASPALLQYVSGLGPKTAEAVVTHRDENGPFRRRDQLLTVRGIGPKAYQQAAGFLRIPDGDVPLDNTAVHPESYSVVERLMEAMRDAGRQWEKRVTWEALSGLIPEYRRHFDSLAELAEWLEVGEMTLADILGELEKPGRDPRDEVEAPILRSDVLAIEDLRPGMQLKGTVRNVVDFGAFVDIGVKQDGLVHISEMSDRHVRDPYAIVSVGDVVEVTVLSVDVDRGRIGLSLRRGSGNQTLPGR